jgi:hypothetical protein
MSGDIASGRIAEIQARAEWVLARCDRALVPIAEAPRAECGGSCFACGRAPDVRIEMRASGAMAAPYGEVAAGTPMFWCNACPAHHDEPVQITVSQ